MWTITLTFIGAIIWFVHRETGIEALPRVKAIDTLEVAEASTTYENGVYLENMKLFYFEEENLAELEAILKGAKIRRETILNKVSEDATSEYLLNIVMSGQEYRFYLEDTNRIIVHSDRIYILQDDTLIHFLKARFNSDTVHVIGQD